MGESWGYVVSSLVLFLLCAVAALCITCAHVLFVSKDSPKQRKAYVPTASPRHNSSEVRPQMNTLERMQQLHTERTAYWRGQLHKDVVHYGTWTALVAYTAMPVISALMRTSHMEWLGAFTFGCRIFAFTFTAFWGLAKNSMYFVFIARVHTTFKDTRYRYSFTVTNSLYAIVLVSFLVTESIIPFCVNGDNENADFTTSGQRVDDDSNRDGMIVCVPKVNRFLLAYVVLMDVVFTVVLLAMFIRPLRKLLAEMHSDEDSAAIGSQKLEQLEIRLLPLKYTVLCAVAVLSTMLTLLVSAVARQNALTSLDAVVNMSCLLLMTRFWKKVYWRICAPLLRCISMTDACVNAQTKDELNTMISAFS